MHQLAVTGVQVGDEVVYILKQHEKCEKEFGKQPGVLGSKQLPKVSLRESEPCRVHTITYSTWQADVPAQRYTVARLELVPLAPQLKSAGGASSSGAQLKLTVDIPPPLDHFVDFVVPLRSYEDGCRRVHKVGDEVRSCMVDLDSGRCEWYNGKVVSDTLEGRVISDADLFTTDQVGRYKV